MYTIRMELFFTPLHVFAATLVAFIIGSLWYSPILFLKAYLLGEGLSKEHKQNLGALYMIQIQLYSFVAHGAIASVLALLFDIVGVTSLKLAISLGLLVTFGFVVTSRFVDMLYTPKGKHYEKQAQIKFLVSAGYYLTVVSVMSAVLFLLTVR